MLIAVCCVNDVGRGRAQTVGLEERSSDQRRMTGDWSGLRTTLANDGVVVHGGYVAEMSGNPTGGHSQGFDYAHQFEFGTDIDFARLTGVDIGTLSFSLTERAGHSLSADRIGNLEEVQEIFGSGETVRLSRLSLRRAFGSQIEAGIGWSNEEENFASSSVYWGQAIYCLYQSLGFCGKPPTLGQNSGYTFIPRVVPGAWLKLYPTLDHSLVFGFGIYAVDPTIQNAHNGFKIGLDNASGSFIPVELGWHRGWSDEKGAFPGTYRIGGYYDTSEVKIVTGQARGYIPSNITTTDLPQEKVRGRYGGWLLADQMIERDRGDPHRGIVVLAVFTYGDSKTAILPYYGSFGLARKGTFRTRPDDILALGFLVAAVNPRLAQYESRLNARGLAAPRQSQEMVVELNYGYQVTEWSTLHPGIQYVWHPAGENEIPNAFVMDLQVKAVF